MRQVDAAAGVQPHVRALPGAAGRGRSQRRRSECPHVQGGRRPDPREDRHDLPEADAVSDVDLRQHCIRGAAVRGPAEVGDGRPRRVGAAQGCAVERGEGQARAKRHQPVGGTAAAAVHRARHRRAARDHPVRRAMLGARSDLHREDRGTDRRAEVGLHGRDRHPQHAAGGTRVRLHGIHVPRAT